MRVRFREIAGVVVGGAVGLVSGFAIALSAIEIVGAHPGSGSLSGSGMAMALLFSPIIVIGCGALGGLLAHRFAQLSSPENSLPIEGMTKPGRNGITWLGHHPAALLGGIIAAIIGGLAMAMACSDFTEIFGGSLELDFPRARVALDSLLLIATLLGTYVVGRSSADFLDKWISVARRSRGNQ